MHAKSSRMHHPTSAMNFNFWRASRAETGLAELRTSTLQPAVVTGGYTVTDLPAMGKSGGERTTQAEEGLSGHTAAALPQVQSDAKSDKKSEMYNYEKQLRRLVMAAGGELGRRASWMSGPEATVGVPSGLAPMAHAPARSGVHPCSRRP